MGTLMEWEERVALQLDFAQWTGDRMGPRGGMNAMEGTDTFCSRRNLSKIQIAHKSRNFSAKPEENYGKPVRIFGTPADSRFHNFLN